MISLCSHAGMKERFRTFDVIMKIVPKLMNQIDCLVPRFFSCVPWKKNKRYVSNIFPYQSSFLFYTFRRIFGEDNLRTVCSSPSTFLQFSKKNFSQYNVILVFEYGRKYHRNPIISRFQVHRFFISVMDH